MNKLNLLTSITILCCGIISESRAEEIPTSGTCNNEGTCLWTLSPDGTLNILAKEGSKDVIMDPFKCDDGVEDTRPWKDSIKNIKNIVVGNNITNISHNAFEKATNLEAVTGMKDVRSLGTDAFFDTGLEYIEMPSVISVGMWAFTKTKLISVDMPKVTEIYSSAFAGTHSLTYVGFNPENITKWGDGIFANSMLENCDKTGTSCGSCGNGYIMGGRGCVSDCGAGYLGKDGRCIDSSNGCGAGYRQFENFCNRIQYTPAEAAKVLKDDNTNEVTITFKK
jgi:hypothetical protein